MGIHESPHYFTDEQIRYFNTITGQAVIAPSMPDCLLPLCGTAAITGGAGFNP